MSQVLHIVSFDNPNPPDYGGAIDVFYKIKAFHALGVKIHLHYFQDKRMETGPLSRYCETIHAYPKTKNPFQLFSRKPLAVQFRQDRLLLENLLVVEAPILFEGLQTTGVLDDKRLQKRTLLLRAHNIEHDYYEGLAQSETNLTRKFIFRIEARKFRDYERILQKVDTVLALSRYEHDYFDKIEDVKSNYIPVFQGFQEVEKRSPFGEFALYHGDLAISDNLRVARFLIKVFEDLDYPLVIAGNKNLEAIEKFIGGHKHIRCAKITIKEDLNFLFEKAHINLCLSFQRSGTKLKVVHAIYQGRHCIINGNVIDEPAVIQLCHLAETAAVIQTVVEQLKKMPFQETEKRVGILQSIFNTRKNAAKIIRLLNG